MNPAPGHSRLQHARAFATRTGSQIARTRRPCAAIGRGRSLRTHPTWVRSAQAGADHWFMQTQRVPTQPHLLTSCQPLPSHSYL